MQRAQQRPRHLVAIAVPVVLSAASLSAAQGPGREQSHPAAGPDASTSRVGDGRGGFRARRVARFSSPVYVTGPEGARGALFVVERRGRIVVVKDGRKLDRPFLDISRKVSTGGEQGMLSVAFAPNYRRSGLFYVYFTDRQGDVRVEEFKRKRGSRYRAAKRSGNGVIEIRHRRFSNHKGGQVEFGPGGHLYLAPGDGGGAGDPSENAQDRGSLLGKLLRIDPKRGRKSGHRNPKGNPFVGERGENEIYARGLRNPFRFSFDRKRIVIGDVGQDAIEEIDLEGRRGARNANFGWDAFEGTRRFDRGTPAPENHDKPIHQYSHGGGRCSVIGGYVVRDRRIRSLFGRYVYGDFCNGEMFSLVPRRSGARDVKSLGIGRVDGLTTFGEDARNRVYFASLTSGKLFRLAPR